MMRVAPMARRVVGVMMIRIQILMKNEKGNKLGGRGDRAEWAEPC
jgi:hypothetical protein